MKIPSGPVLTYESLGSTQDEAAKLLLAGEKPGVVFAHDQTAGRGRQEKVWLSEQTESFTASFVMDGYADHEQPWLVGMAFALGVAKSLRCQLQWPNDLTHGGKKLGGILIELKQDDKGAQIPVVGLGVNVNQSDFQEEVADFATSLYLLRGVIISPLELVPKILKGLEGAPEPTGWGELAPAWMLFDDTPGKKYRLADGREAVGLGLGPDGQLLCAVDGETTSVLAATALFGS